MPKPESTTIRVGSATGWLTLMTSYRARGVMTAYEHPQWKMRYRLGSGKEGGTSLGNAWIKASRAPADFRTHAQAIKAAEDYLAPFAEVTSAQRGLTFRVAAERYVEELISEKERTPNTIAGYRSIINVLSKRTSGRGKIAQTAWGERTIDTFDGEEIKALRTELITKRGQQTVNKYRTIIRGVFGDQSPQAKAFPWKPLSREKARGSIQFYTEDEVALVVANAASDLDALAYTLAAEAGLRKGEILGLRSRHVDFKRRRLQIEEEFTAKAGWGTVKSHAKRSVPMSDNCYDRLWAACEAGRDDAIFAREGTADWPIDGYGLLDRFLALGSALGLHRIVFHELRHTFGTTMIAYVDINVLREWMGHADISTTQIYLHYKPAHDEAAVMSRAWAASSPTSNVVALNRLTRLPRPSELTAANG